MNRLIISKKQVSGVRRLRQMASAAREFALFSVLDIWRKFVGDLH